MADRPESRPFLLPFLTAKGAADAALLAGPMTVTVLRPSGLTDEPGQGTVQAAEHLTPDDWGGDRSPMVSRQDIAAIAVACAVDGLGAGRAYDIVGGSTPLLDALADLLPQRVSTARASRTSRATVATCVSGPPGTAKGPSPSTVNSPRQRRWLGRRVRRSCGRCG